MKPEDELKLIQLMTTLGFDKEMVMETVFYAYATGSIGLGFSKARTDIAQVRYETFEKRLDALKQVGENEI